MSCFDSNNFSRMINEDKRYFSSPNVYGCHSPLGPVEKIIASTILVLGMGGLAAFGVLWHEQYQANAAFKVSVEKRVALIRDFQKSAQKTIYGKTNENANKSNITAISGNLKSANNTAYELQRTEKDFSGSRNEKLTAALFSAAQIGFDVAGVNNADFSRLATQEIPYIVHDIENITINHEDARFAYSYLAQTLAIANKTPQEAGLPPEETKQLGTYCDLKFFQPYKPTKDAETKSGMTNTL
jgi:hypothetical protein